MKEPIRGGQGRTGRELADHAVGCLIVAAGIAVLWAVMAILRPML